MFVSVILMFAAFLPKSCQSNSDVFVAILQSQMLSLMPIAGAIPKWVLKNRLPQDPKSNGIFMGFSLTKTIQLWVPIAGTVPMVPKGQTPPSTPPG